ncbi:hypothetical protein KIPB_012752, partial [Kipferlia bialata]
QGLPSATDMNGNYVYYMPYYKGAFMFGDNSSGQITRTSGKGTWFMWGMGTNTLNPDLSSASLGQTWAEVDLEGVPIWMMTTYEVNDLMYAAGVEMVADVFGHHDSIRTPDGRTLIMGGYSVTDMSIPKEEFGILDWRANNAERALPLSVERAEEVAEQHWDFVLEFGADHSLTKAWKVGGACVCMVHVCVWCMCVYGVDKAYSVFKHHVRGYPQVLSRECSC